MSVLLLGVVMVLTVACLAQWCCRHADSILRCHPPGFTGSPKLKYKGLDI